MVLNAPHAITHSHATSESIQKDRAAGEFSISAGR